MIKIITVVALFLSAVLLVSAPWISALIYSLVSLLQPQYIWNWAFGDIPVFKISAGLLIVGWFMQALRGNVNWSVYSSGQFIGMVILLIIFYLSTWLSPYQVYTSAVSGDLVIDIYTTILVMYFVVIGVINKVETIRYFGLLFILVTLYYAYWANNHYLSGNWLQFSMGRLNGPRGSPYNDGNVMSILLTMGLSFVMFGIRFAKSKWSKCILIFSIPLIWHALILFASRGALLSAGSVTVFFAIVVRSKLLTIFMVSGLLGIVLWQGATLTTRTSTTISHAQNESTERPTNARLVSWKIGWDLTKAYPLLGVGPQRFLFASKNYSTDKSRHVAHNTFLNFSANTGVIAGIIYLMFFYWSYRQYKYVRKYAIDNSDHQYMNLSCMGGLVAFFVGALFLDLIIFEPFYLLLLLTSSNYYLLKNNQIEFDKLVTSRKELGQYV